MDSEDCPVRCSPLDISRDITPGPGFQKESIRWSEVALGNSDNLHCLLWLIIIFNVSS